MAVHIVNSKVNEDRWILAVYAHTARDRYLVDDIFEEDLTQQCVASIASHIPVTYSTDG